MQPDFESIEEVEPGCWRCQRSDKSLCTVQIFSDESGDGYRLSCSSTSMQNEHLAKIEEVRRIGGETEVRTGWYGCTLRWHLAHSFSHLAALNALASGLRGIAALRSYGIVHTSIQPASLWVDVSGNGVLACFWSTNEAGVFTDLSPEGKSTRDVFALGKVAAWIRGNTILSGEERRDRCYERALTDFEEIACSEDPSKRSLPALWTLLRDAIHREMLQEEAVFFARHSSIRSNECLTLRQHHESASGESSSRLSHTTAYDLSLHFLKSATIYQSQRLYDLADYCYTCCILACDFLEIADLKKKVQKVAQGNREEMRSRVDAQLGLA